MARYFEPNKSLHTCCDCSLINCKIETPKSPNFDEWSTLREQVIDHEIDPDDVLDNCLVYWLKDGGVIVKNRRRGVAFDLSMFEFESFEPLGLDLDDGTRTSQQLWPKIRQVHVDDFANQFGHGYAHG